MRSLIVFCAQYLFIAQGLLVLLTLGKLSKGDRLALVTRGLIVLVIGVVLAKTAGALYVEQRPFVRMHLAPMISHVPDNGFPSDHTLLAFGIALLILQYSKPIGLLAMIVAALVAWGRVASLLHSPLDIIASVLFAVLANAGAVLAARRRNIPPSSRSLVA